MKKKNQKTVAEKISDIQNLWDNEEAFVRFMPDREMYCTFDFESDTEPCDIHGEDASCIMNSPITLNSVCLDCNTDWLAWELEMME